MSTWFDRFEDKSELRKEQAEELDRLLGSITREKFFDDSAVIELMKFVLLFDKGKSLDEESRDRLAAIILNSTYAKHENMAVNRNFMGEFYGFNVESEIIFA